MVVRHTCHARQCTTNVPPEMFMCKPHWRMVPADLRSLIWLHYRPGQEVDKNPSLKYLDVAMEAINVVAEMEQISG